MIKGHGLLYAFGGEIFEFEAEAIPEFKPDLLPLVTAKLEEARKVREAEEQSFAE